MPFALTSGALGSASLHGTTRLRGRVTPTASGRGTCCAPHFTACVGRPEQDGAALPRHQQRSGPGSFQAQDPPPGRPRISLLLCAHNSIWVRAVPEVRPVGDEHEVGPELLRLLVEVEDGVELQRNRDLPPAAGPHRSDVRAMCLSGI
jgi:hypothetical protein